MATEWSFCPECRSELQSGFRFCPYCAFNLDPERPNHQADSESPQRVPSSVEVMPPEPPPLPGSGVTIEFGHSSSARFPEATRLARDAPVFAEWGEGRSVIYRASYPKILIESSLRLAKLVRGWKSSRVFLDGKMVTWESLFGFSWCYERRQASYRPPLYCFGLDENRVNPWGCIQTQLGLHQWADCWRWGKFVSRDGTWEFDKSRLRHELSRRLFEYRLCPALDLGLLEELVEALPSPVNPNRNADWQFVEGYEEVPGCLVVAREPTSFTGVLLRFGGDRRYLVGVAPNGLRAVKAWGRKLRTRAIPQELLDLPEDAV